jgi:hypothetical protein
MRYDLSGAGWDSRLKAYLSTQRYFGDLVSLFLPINVTYYPSAIIPYWFVIDFIIIYLSKKGKDLNLLCTIISSHPIISTICGQTFLFETSIISLRLSFNSVFLIMYPSSFHDFLSHLSLHHQYNTDHISTSGHSHTRYCSYCTNDNICIMKRSHISTLEYSDIIAVFISCPILYSIFFRIMNRRA